MQVASLISVGIFVLICEILLLAHVEMWCYKGAPYEAFSAAMARFMHTLIATGTLSQSLQVGGTW